MGSIKIVLASRKGGTGKSTLARSIAMYLLQINYKPAIVDADSQESIHRMNEKMKDSGEGHEILNNLKIVPDPEATVIDTIEELVEENYNPIIVDTAGFGNKTTGFALAAADIALIPMKPSEDDMMQALATIELVKRINGSAARLDNPIKYKVILTMTDQRTHLRKAIRRDLEKLLMPVLEAEMFQRVSYPEAALEGLSPVVTEPDGAAARDIEKIVNEVMGL